MPLANESKLCTTINTHLRLFQYNRLCFGMASTQSMFQRVVDNLLQGMTYVGGYLDDILITGATRKEHDVNLDMILHRLEKARIRNKGSKSQLMKDEVEIWDT